MTTALQVLGVVFVVILALLIGGGLYLWSKWRHIKELMKGYAAQPAVIRVQADTDPEWMASDPVKKWRRELDEMGFSKGRPCVIDKMPDVRMCPFFSSDRHMVCVIYRHETAGCWLDFGVQYKDGTDLTVTNAPCGDEVDSRPDCVKIFLKNAPLSACFEEISRVIEEKPLVLIDSTNFADEFEKAYARDMAWRNSRGGATEEEVKRVAKNMNLNIKDEQITQALEEIKVGEIYQWHDECIETFSRETTMPVSRWVDYEDSLIIVGDQLNGRAFIEYLSDFMNLSDEQIDRFQDAAASGASVQSLFAQINEFRPARLKAEQVGAVTAPIAADIYYVPPDE